MKSRWIPSAELLIGLTMVAMAVAFLGLFILMAAWEVDGVDLRRLDPVIVLPDSGAGVN